MQAAFVEGTNLVMVWIVQDKTSDNCYDETQCPKVEPSEVPFGFEPVAPSDPSEKCDGIPHRKPSRSNSMCYIVLHEWRAKKNPSNSVDGDVIEGGCRQISVLVCFDDIVVARALLADRIVCVLSLEFPLR
uniref:Uncharacterized protein n=1 Tax=Angiostrongylus cantonensis TaxID=6313 RepID=A0A0K0CYK2_ANGCA